MQRGVAGRQRPPNAMSGIASERESNIRDSGPKFNGLFFGPWSTLPPCFMEIGLVGLLQSNASCRVR